MKGKVVLDGSDGQIWPPDFDIQNAKVSRKLGSILELITEEGSQVSAVSSHGSFVATSVFKEDRSNLYVTLLKENRFFLCKIFPSVCHILKFHPRHETLLFLASCSGHVFKIDVASGNATTLLGHSKAPVGIQLTPLSPLVLSYSRSAVLVWELESATLLHRLQVEEDATIVMACHQYERGEVIACFSNGSVLLWHDETKESLAAIQVPANLSMEFSHFCISRNGDWLIGGGAGDMIVVYSLLTYSVTKVVKLPSLVSILQIDFIPPLNPKYNQVLAVLSSCGKFMIIDFSTSTKLKSVKSQKYKISTFSHSFSSSLFVLMYDNGNTLLYTSSAFIPVEKKETVVAAVSKHEVGFEVVEACKDESHRSSTKVKDNMEEVKELLNTSHWYTILQQYGEYPYKYRLLIWTSFLSVPRNYNVYSGLLDKGVHPAFSTIERVLAVQDKGLLDAFKRTLSCLAHWAPFLANVDILPEFVFPFVKFMHDNRLVCFEVVATIILNWCRFWFEFWPKPSVTVLNAIEQILCDQSPDLLGHFMKLKITAKDYAWVLLTSAFSRIVDRKAWAIVWDHIISNKPSFMLCLVVAFSVSSKRTLIACQDYWECKEYFLKESWISVKTLIDKSYHIYDKTSWDGLPKKQFDDFVVIPRDSMPLFNIGPQDIRQEKAEGVAEQLTKLRIDSEAQAAARGHRGHRCSECYVVCGPLLHEEERRCLANITDLRKKFLNAAVDSVEDRDKNEGATRGKTSPRDRSVIK